MNNNNKKLLRAIAMAQLTLAGSTLSYAQVLEEVIVTARKQAENLMDAPVAVSVVSGAQMNREGITNLEQISIKTPGL